MIWAALTQRTQCILLDGRQAAVVYCQMAYVQSQKYETLQLGQIIVAELQIKYDRTFSLQRAHRFGNMHQIRGLAQYIQSVLLHRAYAGRNIALLWAHLLRCALGECLYQK